MPLTQFSLDGKHKQESTFLKIPVDSFALLGNHSPVKQKRLNGDVPETVYWKLKEVLAKQQISIRQWILKMAKKETGVKLEKE